jgi:hypothetical protein
VIGCLDCREDVVAVVALEPVTDVVPAHELQVDEFVSMLTPGADVGRDGPVRIQACERWSSDHASPLPSE